MKRKRDSTDAVATTSICVDGGGDSSSGAEFEVFLSFRGPDTRLSFTDCLYHSMVRAGIRVFRDDEEIRKGEKIAGELLGAIESSKIYVPIFSKNYASSAWCLRELAHMVECSAKANDKVILPIFYDVSSDDVKLRTPSYLNALEKHEKSGREDVRRWKEALTEVARIKGWDLRNRGHGELINTIVDKVLTMLMKKRRNLPDYLVGIHDHVEAVRDLLDEGSHDVLYLVIHGMGGVGKTTLANAVFNRIFNQFQGCSFLSDIRESAQHGRITNLQNQLLSEILPGRSPKIHESVDAGVNIIAERFRDKKILLVLDDMDKWEHLSKLAGKSSWFGPGSRIIVTTRDINFLPMKEDEEESNFQAHSEEFKIYGMTEMDSFHALQLFSKHAFSMDFPPDDYDDISRKITSQTGRLPLALEVIGSSLYRKSKKFWKATLKKLESVPNQEVLHKLKISYDMLEHRQREIFLDIACYFVGKERLHPYYMWKALNYFPKSEVIVLIRKSLVKILENDALWMHDQLRDLGREIVYCEDINVPGKRSRLWVPKIALDVIRMKEGTDKVVALRLTGPSKVHNFTSEEFSKLPNLRFLELEGGNLVGDFKNLLFNLRWLSWSDCPSELNATNLCLEKLAVLELSGSDITEDWTGWGPCLVSENLKVIRITHCPSLKRTPDFSKCLNLKRLVLQECPTSLVIAGSLSKLEHLKHLQIKPMGFPKSDDGNLFAVPSVLGGLKSLSTLKIESMPVRELHHSAGEMKRLEYLSLATCLFLRTLPDTIGKLESLLELKLDNTGITDLPHFIGDLKMLRKMSLVGTRIKKLPDTIGGLESLLDLDLRATNITELPSSIGNLKRLEILRLDGTSIKELPRSIGMLKNLKELKARHCRNLEQGIPSEIGSLSLLRMIDLRRSSIRRLPTTINQLTSLQQLCLDECDGFEKFPELPMSLKELEFAPHLLWTAVDLSYLTTLVNIHIRDIRDDTRRLSEFTHGAPKIEWIEGLSSLERLTLLMTDVAFPLINLATLSRLRILEITCVDPGCLVELPSSLEKLSLYDVKSPMERSLFSNLINLSSLELRKCRLREVELDDVLGQQLANLRVLNVIDCELLGRLSVSRFKVLQSLVVSDRPVLTEIQGVEELGSLGTLNIHRCSCLQRLPDLSELRKLRLLGLSHCPLQNLSDLRLQDTCLLAVTWCGISPGFSGDYKKWKDAYSRSGDDINIQP